MLLRGSSGPLHGSLSDPGQHFARVQVIFSWFNILKQNSNIKMFYTYNLTMVYISYDF